MQQDYEHTAITKEWLIEHNLQLCPRCNDFIGNINGSKDAVCGNCGYKDPCCE